MSTKIYSAYITKESFSTPFDAQTYTRKIVKKYKAKWIKNTLDTVYRIVRFNIDKKYVENKFEIEADKPFLDGKSLGDYCEYVANNYILKENGLSYAYTKDNKIVFIPFFGDNELENQFAKNFNYYGYWDNTDPDENCSKEEWKERKKFWKFLDIPKQDMMNQTFFDNRMIQYYLIEHVSSDKSNSFEARVQQQSEYVLGREIRQFIPVDRGTFNLDIQRCIHRAIEDTHEKSEFHRKKIEDIYKWYDKERIKKRYFEIEKVVREILPKNYTSITSEIAKIRGDF